MEIKFTSQVVVSPEETNGRLPRRSLDLLNINTPELMQLAPLRSEIAPKGLARARALVAYSERLRNTYRANESGLREGMKLLAETVNNGQPIVVSCFCRAGEMCHADVVKLAIEKVQQRVLLHDRAKRKAEHSPSITRSVDIPNPRTQRAINEILSVSKSDLLLARIDQTDGRSRYEHASYLNQHSQFARDLYERGATVSGNAVIVPKEKLSIAAGLDIPTNQYAVKKLEHITGDRSKVAELAPQIVEYGQKIAGSDADRETQLRVFNWIYQSLEGKTEFLDSGDRTFSEESKEERFERTMTDIANLAHELSQLEPSDHFVPLDTVFERDHDHAKDENHELLRDEDGSLARGPSEATNASHVEFERFEIGNLELAHMVSEMSHNEREHWFNVRLPAIDKELEDGKPVSEILDVYGDTIYATAIHEPSRKHEAVDDLRFASAYIENQLRHPDSMLRHFNARYRQYAAMLDRASTRTQVIETASAIRGENARLKLTWKELSAGYKSATPNPLASKEMQFLFTEVSPSHYTNDMTAARLAYSNAGTRRQMKTDALVKGEIKPSQEAQQLVESLESRLERRYLKDSLGATKHFLQSLKTPNHELRYQNDYDHKDLYSKLPPPEKDFIYQRAVLQKEALEARLQANNEKVMQNDLTLGSIVNKSENRLTDIRRGIVSDLVEALRSHPRVRQSVLTEQTKSIVNDRIGQDEPFGPMQKEIINALSNELTERIKEISRFDRDSNTMDANKLVTAGQGWGDRRVSEKPIIQSR